MKKKRYATPPKDSNFRKHQGKRRPLDVRFWEKVQKSDGCWNWLGASNGRYGRIGTGVGTKAAYAHRVSWELTNGPIPEGMQIDHKCRNTLCVNPDHLRVCTEEENHRFTRQDECGRGHRDRWGTSSRGWSHCLQCHADRERERRAKAKSRSAV